MTVTLINYADAVARIEKAAEGRLDYVNVARTSNGYLPTCRNLNEDGSGSCIVGTAFHAELIEAGLTPTDDDNFAGVATLLDRVLFGRYEATTKAIHFLERVQEVQDQGMAWGEAIEDAKGFIAKFHSHDDDAHAVNPMHV